MIHAIYIYEVISFNKTASVSQYKKRHPKQANSHFRLSISKALFISSTLTVNTPISAIAKIVNPMYANLIIAVFFFFFISPLKNIKKFCKYMVCQSNQGYQILWSFARNPGHTYKNVSLSFLSNKSDIIHR